MQEGKEVSKDPYIIHPYANIPVYWIDGDLVTIDLDVDAEIMAHVLAGMEIDYKFFILKAMLNELKGKNREEFLALKPSYESQKEDLDDGIFHLMSSKLFRARMGLSAFEEGDVLDRLVADWFLRKLTKPNLGGYAPTLVFMAQSPHSSRKVIETFLNTKNPLLLIPLCQNPNLTQSDLTKLLEFQNTHVILAALKSWKGYIPHKIAKKLIERPALGFQKTEILTTLASKKLEYETQELIMSGVRSDEWLVRKALYENLATDESIKSLFIKNILVRKLKPQDKEL